MFYQIYRFCQLSVCNRLHIDLFDEGSNTKSHAARYIQHTSVLHWKLKKRKREQEQKQQRKCICSGESLGDLAVRKSEIRPCWHVISIFSLWLISNYSIKISPKHLFGSQSALEFLKILKWWLGKPISNDRPSMWKMKLATRFVFGSHQS